MNFFVLFQFMRDEFIQGLRTNQRTFDLELSSAVLERLADYFDLVQTQNQLLHLVGPCSPEQFATRHILESLTVLEHLPKNAKLADIGAGAGLPSIPCLIVRIDLTAILIESKEKKAKFLESALIKLELSGRAKVVSKQFEETSPDNAEFITCRALDKFSEKLPRLLKWAKRRRILFFGGPSLGEKLRENGVNFTERLMPLSERRYLFIEKI